MVEGIIYRYKSPSGKYYIGQTIDEHKRRIKFLNKDISYGGPKIENARKKYGPENFEYCVLMKVEGDNPDEVKKYLNILEIYFIKKYDSINNGYNLQEGGNSHKGQVPWNKGKKLNIIPYNKGKHMSDEQKKKLSESHKGKTPWNKGIPHTEEQKNKLRIARQGRVYSEETKKKISVGNKGKHQSEEAKRKIGEHHRGTHRVYNPDGTYHYE